MRRFSYQCCRPSFRRGCRPLFFGCRPLFFGGRVLLSCLAPELRVDLVRGVVGDGGRHGVRDRGARGRVRRHLLVAVRLGGRPHIRAACRKPDLGLDGFRQERGASLRGEAIFIIIHDLQSGNLSRVDPGAVILRVVRDDGREVAALVLEFPHEADGADRVAGGLFLLEGHLLAPGACYVRHGAEAREEEEDRRDDHQDLPRLDASVLRVCRLLDDCRECTYRTWDVKDDEASPPTGAVV
mmetsp:Transcript_19008/g.44240  ORF Transcript_19008/g.44240 Transcript_19008/m.44240 type:complete len:240 (-) Transcript_19008:2788-3507(-)